MRKETEFERLLEAVNRVSEGLGRKWRAEGRLFLRALRRAHTRSLKDQAREGRVVLRILKRAWRETLRS